MLGRQTGKRLIMTDCFTLQCAHVAAWPQALHEVQTVRNADWNPIYSSSYCHRVVLRTSPNYAAQAGQGLLQTLALSSFPGATWGKIGLLSLMSITEMYTIAVALSRGDPWSVTSTVNWWWACFSWSNATQFIISPEGQRKWGRKRFGIIMLVPYLWHAVMICLLIDLAVDIKPQFSKLQPVEVFCQSVCLYFSTTLHSSPYPR